MVEAVRLVLTLKTYLTVALGERVLKLNIVMSSAELPLLRTLSIGVETASSILLLLLNVLNSIIPSASVWRYLFNTRVRIKAALSIRVGISVDILTLNLPLILGI